jgi:UDP-GlcNAc3NAcA epimerase
MRIASIVGARPEFVQVAPVSRALRRNHQEILIHTGQHYDDLMSRAFFDQLEIPSPDYNLGVGSGPQGWQTGEILQRLEQVLLNQMPDLVIVRGDTNSTLAGALAASKLHIPIAHVEAGERSFDRRMPEEINRVVAGAVADLHFCASPAAVKWLAAEGIRRSVYWVGDVMLDALLRFLPTARDRSTIMQQLDLRGGDYALTTVHRAANTDDPARLSQIMEALSTVEETVIFPAHPRTRKVLESTGIYVAANVRLLEPVSYFDMLVLEENARLIATDSGGVQREAYYLGVPCLTLREETEWVETVDAGWNRLVGIVPAVIREAWFSFEPPAHRPPVYGDGTAAQQIAAILENSPLLSELPAQSSALVQELGDGSHTSP